MLRPRLNDFALIERNFIGSRLYANPLIYNSNFARTGYFLVVLSLIGLRFTVLQMMLKEGASLDEKLWLAAARKADGVIQHNKQIMSKLVGLVEQHIHTDMQNLAAPALF